MKLFDCELYLQDLFDPGVTNTLARVRTLERHSNLYGRAFEQFVAIELRAAISYQRSPARLAYWRTYDKNEVDFVVGDICAIEVKATERTFLVSHDPVERLKEGIRFMPYGRFLEIWSGDLLSGKFN